MTTPTLTPTSEAFAHDPFIALGRADAYDEHQAHTPVHVLLARAHTLLDDNSGQLSTELYAFGYSTAVMGITLTHAATVTAQTELAYAEAGEPR